MITYKTKMNLQTNLYPTKLDFKRTEVKRNLLSDFELKYCLKEYEKLEKAKKQLIDMIHENGLDDWVLIEDYWTRYHGSRGIDFILITRYAVYTFTVTALDGKFSYDSGFTLVDGGVLSGNLVENTWMTRCVIEDILYPINPDLYVNTALILMGDTPSTPLGTCLETVPVVTKEHFPTYIQDIAEREAGDTEYMLDIERLITQLECMEIPKAALPIAYYDEFIEHTTKGIHCDQCINYNIKITDTHVVCSCGHEEILESATRRTIEDFKTLTYEYDLLKTPLLLEFFNHQVSESYLESILNTYLAPTN